MAASRTPAGYGFNFVLEHPGPLDPRIPFRVVAYSEPARQTRNVRLLGKQRALVFLRDKPSRDRYFKLGWTDRTAAFLKEWSTGFGGEWNHREPRPALEPITQPDTRQKSPASGLNGSAAGVSLLDGDDRLSVKRLVSVLASGKYDSYLDEMLDFERSKESPRSGAVSAIASRIGTLHPRT